MSQTACGFAPYSRRNIDKLLSNPSLLWRQDLWLDTHLPMNVIERRFDLRCHLLDINFGTVVATSTDVAGDVSQRILSVLARRQGFAEMLAMHLSTISIVSKTLMPDGWRINLSNASRSAIRLDSALWSMVMLGESLQHRD